MCLIFDTCSIFSIFIHFSPYSYTFLHTLPLLATRSFLHTPPLLSTLLPFLITPSLALFTLFPFSHHPPPSSPPQDVLAVQASPSSPSLPSYTENSTCLLLPAPKDTKVIKLNPSSSLPSFSIISQNIINQIFLAPPSSQPYSSITSTKLLSHLYPALQYSLPSSSIISNKLFNNLLHLPYPHLSLCLI